MSSVEKGILNHFNKTPKLVLLLAKYFANAKKALEAKMVDVDSHGFVLYYLEPNPDEPGNVAREITIKFNSPVKTKDQVIKKINDMIQEATTILSLEVDKNYIPPGRNALVLFTAPSMTDFSLCILTWSYLIHAAITQVVFVNIPAINLLFCLVIINVAQSFGLFLLCLQSELPYGPTLKWTGVTLLFGIITLRPAIQTCVKYKQIQ